MFPALADRGEGGVGQKERRGVKFWQGAKSNCCIAEGQTLENSDLRHIFKDLEETPNRPKIAYFHMARGLIN